MPEAPRQRRKARGVRRIADRDAMALLAAKHEFDRIETHPFSNPGSDLEICPTGDQLVTAQT